MASEADRNCPERRDFIDAIEYLKDPWNKEKLQRLMSDRSWKRFVPAAKLSRVEADALFADLSQLATFMAMQDKEYRERFMKLFPPIKEDLEKRIQKLYTLANEVDKVHRDCTITQVAASSTGAVSGILTITGLCLAPVTAGASLALSATGLGLGIAAGVTGVTANIVEVSKDVSAKAKANSLASTGSDTEKVLKEVLSLSTPEIASLAQRCFQNLQGIVKNARAFNLAKSNPLLAAKAVGFMRRGTFSARSSKQLQKAFGGTALAMSKEARVLGATTAGVSLIMDVVDLVKNSKHLHEGAKADSAEELRQQAQELERRLEELTCTHKSIQEATNKQWELQELIGYFLFLLFCFFLYIYIYFIDFGVEGRRREK